MQIDQLKRENSKKENEFFVQMSAWEALLLIESLAAQISHHVPDSERQAFVSDDGIYFSIVVYDNILPK